MDKQIDSRFERIEKALSNLIDSVTKYHPSTIVAEELKAADSELSKGLDEVQAHQNNYLRIQQLRSSSSALDTQIRETLSSLASTRKDIVTTHTTVFPPGRGHPIAYEELLRYARRISKTTMAPASTIARAAPPPAASPDTAQTPVPDSGATPGTRAQTPVATNGGTTSQVDSQPPTQLSILSMNTTLPENMTQYLNPLSGQLFFPWPLEDKIRSGALASNQVLVEQGIDPKGYDPAEEEERLRREEEERKEKEEREKLERAEHERKMMEEREKLRVERERQREKEQEEWRRASVAGGPTQPTPGVNRTNTGAGEKKQFQFTNLDDLDDDDDDE